MDADSAQAQSRTLLRRREVRERLRKKGNRETLSMVMLGYDYDRELFDQDAVFFADAIEKAGWEVRFPVESVGRQSMEKHLQLPDQISVSVRLSCQQAASRAAA